MDRPKQGFGVPINSWLRTAFHHNVHEYLSDSYIKNQGLFDVEYVKRRKKMFFDNVDNTSFIWHLFMFQLWYEKWMS